MPPPRFDTPNIPGGAAASLISRINELACLLLFSGHANCRFYAHCVPICRRFGADLSGCGHRRPECERSLYFGAAAASLVPMGPRAGVQQELDIYPSAGIERQ